VTLRHWFLLPQHCCIGFCCCIVAACFFLVATVSWLLYLLLRHCSIFFWFLQCGPFFVAVASQCDPFLLPWHGSFFLFHCHGMQAFVFVAVASRHGLFLMLWHRGICCHGVLLFNLARCHGMFLLLPRCNLWFVFLPNHGVVLLVATALQHGLFCRGIVAWSVICCHRVMAWSVFVVVACFSSLFLVTRSCSMVCVV